MQKFLLPICFICFIKFTSIAYSFDYGVGISQFNVENTSSYTTCESKTSENYFTLFNPYSGKFIKSYIPKKEDEFLKIHITKHILVFGLRKNNDYEDLVVYSSDKVNHERGLTSAYDVVNILDLITPEKDWGSITQVQIDYGRNIAKIFNEFEDTFEMFKCVTLLNDNSKSNKYIADVFENFEFRLGFSEQIKRVKDEEKKKLIIDQKNNNLFAKGLESYNLGNYVEAINFFTPVAESGDSSAQFNLALIYYSGKMGVSDDTFLKAFKWAKLSGDQGNSASQQLLGEMYFFGRGVSQNDNLAFKWFELAAQQGVASAQFALGNMYDNGWGIAKDLSKAVSWWSKAAKQGHQKAKMNIGITNKCLELGLQSC